MWGQIGIWSNAEIRRVFCSFPCFCLFECDSTSGKTTRWNTAGLPQTHLLPLLTIIKVNRHLLISTYAWHRAGFCVGAIQDSLTCRSGQAQAKPCWATSRQPQGGLGDGWRRGDKGGARNPNQSGDWECGQYLIRSTWAAVLKAVWGWGWVNKCTTQSPIHTFFFSTLFF